jgi:hypothetical protein
MLYYLLDSLKTPFMYADFAKTRVVYGCKVPPKGPATKGVYTIELKDGGTYTVPDNIWDVLGYFTPSKKDTIFLCHTEIEQCANAHKWAYAVLLDIVAIHEYAHMIHFRSNSGKFKKGEVGFLDLKHYVECWANWCTYHVCKSLGSPYREVFEQLNKGQSAPYHEWENYGKWDVKEVVGLFLNEKGWIYLLEEGLISQLSTWPKTAVDWIILNWKDNTGVIALKKSWTDKVFIKDIRDHLNLDKEEDQLGSDLNDLGF